MFAFVIAAALSLPTLPPAGHADCEVATNVALKASAVTVFGATRETRLAELEVLTRFCPSDDLTEPEVWPSPLEVKNKYNLTDMEFVGDLIALSQKYGIAETNQDNRICRETAFSWIGEFGSTNNFEYLATVMTNSSDYAQEAALFASFRIAKHLPELIPIVKGVVTNTCFYSSGLRGQAYVYLLDLCREGESDNYINDPAQHARIAAFFLERVAVEQDNPLFIDRCAYTLNPSYRHSQQRRNNLAALRPPNLTGKPAELYDAAQADAAQED